MPINNSYNEDAIVAAIATALDNFYTNLIKKVDSLNVKAVMKRKNPYLFRAKAMNGAAQIIDAILAAFVSSSEETIFGNVFFEPIATAAAQGQKALAEGVDIMVERDNDRIFQEAKRIAFINHAQDEFALSKNDVLQFAKEKGFYDETNSRQPYETFYNQNVSQLIGATCLHPQTVPVDPEGNGRYKYEVCDFFKDRALYFVKIGKPNDFAYAIDQAMLTLEKCEAGMGSLTLPGDLTVSPTEFRMVLIFEGRAKMVEKWEDVFSINFLIHLTELKRRLSNTDISLTIDFVYW